MRHPFRAVKALTAATGLLLGVILAPAAQAAYPDKPIRLVVPFPPGGNVDVTTRAIAVALGRELNQPIVIDNMGGAAGSIGAANAARAQPDGYTLVSTTLLTMLANPVIVPGIKVRMDDFNLVGVMAAVPCVLEVATGNAQGIRDFRGFLAYARSHPSMSIGHGGNGTMNHLVTLLLASQYQLKLNPIPYKGAAPALADLLGKQVDSLVDQLSGSQTQIQGKTVIPLATTASKRVPSMPDVPTFAELGRPELGMETYTLLMSPKGTPPAVLDKLNTALARALKDPAVLGQLQGLGTEVIAASVTDTQAIVAREEKRLRPLLTPEVLKPEN